MCITLEPAQAAHTDRTRRAIAQGSPLEVYAANLLAESVQGPTNRPPLTEDRIDITLHEMAQ